MDGCGRMDRNSSTALHLPSPPRTGVAGANNVQPDGGGGLPLVDVLGWSVAAGHRTRTWTARERDGVERGGWVGVYVFRFCTKRCVSLTIECPNPFLRHIYAKITEDCRVRRESNRNDARAPPRLLKPGACPDPPA